VADLLVSQNLAPWTDVRDDLNRILGGRHGQRPNLMGTLLADLQDIHRRQAIAYLCRSRSSREHGKPKSAKPRAE
jgi:hypothetical protein